METLKSNIQNNKQLYMLVIIFLALFILMSILSPSKFLTSNNISSMMFQMSELGVLAIGMSIVILTGGINLALSHSSMLAAIIGTLVMQAMVSAGMNPLLTILAGIIVIIAVSLILGAINGFFIAYVGVLPILVTLGTRSVFEGIGLNITKGSALSGYPPEFNFIGNGVFLGIPFPFLIYVAVIIVSTLLIQRTAWGMSVYMIGGNVKATELSGINTKKVLMGVYIICGILCGIAGVIMASRYSSARTDYGSSYVMQAVTAAVLGGTDINGGEGTIIGTVIGVAILQVISSGLNILGVNRNFVDIIIGAILIAVLTIRFFSNINER
ncbi:MAG: ABC transporter permease [Clostridiaceae bacterium]|nr:ABC transporter permease [Clostridiaceae bacterium]